MPSHLTPEQLKFFTDQTERAVHKATSRIVRRATIGFLILLGGLGGQYYVGQHDLEARRTVAQQQRASIVRTGNAVAVSGCNRDFLSAKALRGLLMSATSEVDAAHRRGDITKTQFERAKAFYAAQLALLPLPDCRPVAHFVTSDPDKSILIPTPLHK